MWLYKSAVQGYRDILVHHQFPKENKWLAVQKVATGCEDGVFRPGRYEEIAGFLYRYSLKKIGK